MCFGDHLFQRIKSCQVDIGCEDSTTVNSRSSYCLEQGATREHRPYHFVDAYICEFTQRRSLQTLFANYITYRFVVNIKYINMWYTLLKKSAELIFCVAFLMLLIVLVSF